MITTPQQDTVNFDIINVRLPGSQNLQQVLIRQGKISGIEAMAGLSQPRSTAAIQQIDLQGDLLSLGGIDLQINGGLGLAFPDLEPQNFPKLTKICQYLWEQGIDGFMPTIVTTSIDKIHRSLSTIAEFIQTVPQDKPTAKILGVHLEGPFLNPSKRGAHPQEHLLPLTLEQVQRVLGDYANVVKIITLAPELDPTDTIIPYLTNLGIIVSLGHSQATEEQAERAFNLGARMVTHAFNAMPSLHHREPGLLGAALVNNQVQSGLIADGQHISPLMVNLLLRMSGINQPNEATDLIPLFLVSDALAPLGLPDGVYPWDERQIEVKEGTARLADGTLSGTTLPLFVGVENLVKWNCCDLGEAIAYATIAPRQALGLFSPIGESASQLLRWKLDPASETVTLNWERLLPFVIDQGIIVNLPTDQIKLSK
ncbi:N-acetylglucosamine-6-phosphate deacetylase [Planktothrix agardhii]|jgi:N-acetylglucosamine-6-phosphate deacetylase|uniref:N-acetylglucosamine-6-phosphate deacetylase n=1 Tax=Planktothrix agardhii TaxID=1160 RepID=A0AAD1Q739_PLAAG|nr:N-acetylglucosamine-6-phosphate deacetylase [Planktothrix agardhii]MCB8786348.1 N-acetylglucosamine-6-phosphate deacetylase [Planktothrix agardhii 1025]MCF3612009.1 N-acetylglucosamine-6-phosphate deacetylase [Planktothrix agardhii 1027]MCF3645784.1 N-acetylglucosamine-6-phosphate deacetylase [Planktothrix agardhii 1026]CAD5910998.1 N-acetylglucosamine-6-phosphate deacetylase [Planktothrix agardhii]CAD5973484.1 N-acetylglucosamine-6-phosphate deacetylase [Planktothrix agardhii]